MRRLEIDNTTFVRLYKEHRSITVVARLLNCTDVTVANRLREEGVPRTGRSQFGRPPSNKLVLNEQAVIRHYKQTRNLRKTAAQFKCSTPTITRVLREHGVPRDGKPVFTAKSRKGMSDGIKRTHAAGKMRGENHWAWKGGKVKSACCICGKEIERVPSSPTKNPVCSDACNRKRASEALKGDKAPSWRGAELLTSCAECGKTFRRKHMRSTKRFCSNVCFRKWFRGKNCPFWRGGRTGLKKQIRYNERYLKWRAAVFERDQYTCQECGQVAGILNAHHEDEIAAILERYSITTLEEALACEELWEIGNGRTLCEKCHHKEHSQRYALVRQGSL